MEMPRVEILLATYNGEKYLAEQLDSLLCQTWHDLHITVSDDSSTDCTKDIIEEYALKYPERISVLRHGLRFGNARDHFFYLVSQCCETYMLFCDQDDLWNPDKVEITMRAILNAEKEFGTSTPILVFTDQTVVDERLHQIAPSLMKMQNQDAGDIDYRRMILQNIVTGCAAGINRALAKLAVRCIDTRDVIMHDWWMGIVAARFGKVVYIDQSTMLYRQHGKNSVGAKKVNSAGYIGYVLTHIQKFRLAVYSKKRQAALFCREYSSLLSDADFSFLNEFQKEHSGLVFYWKNRSLFHGLFRLIGMAVLG